MSEIPVLRPEEVIKIFKKFGWVPVRQKGSHIILVKEKHIATLSVPNHDRVARGTLRSLIKKANLTIEEFLEALKKS